MGSPAASGSAAPAAIAADAPARAGDTPVLAEPAMPALAALDEPAEPEEFAEVDGPAGFDFDGKKHPGATEEDSGATSTEEPPCSQAYTYQDGDAQRTVTLCDVIPDEGGGSGGAGAASATACASGDSDADELLFRAESGVEMTLGHSVLLVLNPDWSDAEVRRFLVRNRIRTSCVSPMGWLPNGFTVATGPGIAALTLANALAPQDGVVLSSPNWASDFEVK